MASFTMNDSLNRFQFLRIIALKLYFHRLRDSWLTSFSEWSPVRNMLGITWTRVSFFETIRVFVSLFIWWIGLVFYIPTLDGTL